MRTSFRAANHIRVLASIVLVLLASSCSRSLPTAPVHERERGGANDPFAVVGLENQVVVTLAPGADADQIAAQYGATVVKGDENERCVAFRPLSGLAPATLMSQLVADGRIVTAEPNGWIAPAETRQQSFAFDDGFGNDHTYLEQDATGVLGLAQAQLVATGKGVKVAIIDTGADMHHPVLRDHIVGGWDFVGNDPDPSEQRNNLTYNSVVDGAYGHGTHVAGIVRLVAPDAQLLIVRALNSDGRGDLVSVASGVRWAVAHGAKVINLSLGTQAEKDALQDVLEEAELQGVIVVAALGNWGADPNDATKSTVDFPGSSSHAFGISAADVDTIPAAFSSFNRSDALLAAPGIGIRSAFPGGGYKLWSGTSMAAPWVTGTAALLAEKHPDWNMDMMKVRLQGTATPIVKVPVIGPQPRDYGAGMLNIAKALAPDFVPAANQVPVPEEIVPHRPR